MASWVIPEDEDLLKRLDIEPRPNLIDASNFAENRKRQRRVDLKRAEQQGLIRDPWDSSKFWKKTDDENVVEPVELQRFATWENPVGGPTGLSNINPKEGNAVINDEPINKKFGQPGLVSNQESTTSITPVSNEDEQIPPIPVSNQGKQGPKRFVGRGRNSIAANRERIRKINPLPEETSIGGAGNDTSTGGAGNDTSTGGAGNDTSTGGTGNEPTEIAAEVDKTENTWDAIGAGAKIWAKLLEEQRGKGAFRIGPTPFRSRYRAMRG